MITTSTPRRSVSLTTSKEYGTGPLESSLMFPPCRLTPLTQSGSLPPFNAGGGCVGDGIVYRYEPSFEDNVKQDISIDVYGRKEDDKGDLTNEIDRLANI